MVGIDAPRFKVEMAGDRAASISAAHPDPAICHTLLADAFGTGDIDLACGLLVQTADVARSGKVATRQELNFMLSVVRGINPRDETEALLAAQIAAIHNATMVAARRLNHVETIPQQDSASTMLNKLARTFAGQVEALKEIPFRRRADHQGAACHRQRWRSGHRRQRQPGGGGTTKTGGQPHEPCATDERSELSRIPRRLVGLSQAASAAGSSRAA